MFESDANTLMSQPYGFIKTQSHLQNAAQRNVYSSRSNATALSWSSGVGQHFPAHTSFLPNITEVTPRSSITSSDETPIATPLLISPPATPKSPDYYGNAVGAGGGVTAKYFQFGSLPAKYRVCFISLYQFIVFQTM